MNPITNIEVKSERELSELELSQIQGIFKEAECPNECLINTIKDCKGYINGRVLIGSTEDYTYTVEV